MTDPTPRSTDVFEDHRGLLFTVAYELLGSVGDAEDAVQDSWLRWSKVDRREVTHPRAYLVQIVTRVSLNRLRSLRARREQYVGPWLPDPVLTGWEPLANAAQGLTGDVAEHAEMADQVSLAMLVVLESLSPTERAVFVLHEVFAVPHAETAQVLGRSETAVRQIAHRAREQVAARRPRFVTERAVHLDVTRRFVDACAGGRLDELLEVLAPEVVLTSDTGGLARAARRRVVGADRVGRFLLGVMSKAPEGLRIDLVEVNSAPAILVKAGGQVVTCVQLVVTPTGISDVLMVVNPDKLDLLSGVRTLRVP